MQRRRARFMQSTKATPKEILNYYVQLKAELLFCNKVNKTPRSWYVFISLCAMQTKYLCK